MTDGTFNRLAAILIKAQPREESCKEHSISKSVHAKTLISTLWTRYVSENPFITLRNLINSPFWRMVLDSLIGEKRREILHCPPHEGIGREEAADVRKWGFIVRASSLRVHALMLRTSMTMARCKSIIWTHCCCCCCCTMTQVHLSTKSEFVVILYILKTSSWLDR